MIPQAWSLALLSATPSLSHPSHPPGTPRPFSAWLASSLLSQLCVTRTPDLTGWSLALGLVLTSVL